MKNKKTTSLITIAMVAVVFAAIGYFLNSAFDTKISDNIAREELNLMNAVMPEKTEFTPEEYTGEDENIAAVYKTDGGYVIKTVTYGYVGNVTVLTGVDNNGNVTGIRVTDMTETPGLGERAKYDGAFISQFAGKNGTLTVNENVDALTGATVTSKAVIKGVNSAIAFVTGADIGSSATEWEG